MKAIWQCKIGEVDRAMLPDDADARMSKAIERAYLELTGVEAKFLLSGWDAELTEPERSVLTD